MKQKKCEWELYIDTISDQDMLQIIQDYRALEKDGCIGDSVIRTKAECWCDVHDQGYHVVFVMKDLVFAAYKRFAEVYFEYQNSLRGWDGGE